MNQSVISQHESAIALSPCGHRSLSEANIWGMLSYATGLLDNRIDNRCIHAPKFIGYILVFLEHARLMLRALGLATSIHVEAHMDGVQGVTWMHFPDGHPEFGPSSELDNTIKLTFNTTTDVLIESRDELAVDILR